MQPSPAKPFWRRVIAQIRLRLFGQLLSARASNTVNDLLQISPDLKISPLVFVLPLTLTIIGVLCDGAALALLGPLFLRVLEAGSETRSAVTSGGGFIRGILLLVGLGPNASIGSLVATILFLSLIAIPLRKLGGLLIGLTIRNMSADLQPVLMSRILQFGKLYFQESDLSAIHELRSNASDFVTSGIRLVHRVVESSAFVVFYACVMFSISWQLSLYFLSAGLAMSFLTTRSRGKIQALAVEGVEHTKLLRRQVATCFQGIDIIKANALEEASVERVRVRAERMKEQDGKVIRLTTLSAMMQDVCGLVIVFVAVLLYVVLAKDFGPQTASSAAVFLILARRLLEPISALHSCFLEGAKVAPGLAALQTILDLSDKHVAYSGTIQPSCEAPGIEISDLSFSYPSGFAALKDLNFSIAPGSTVALVGRSGAGKTTLLKLLLKSFEAPEAAIFADGVDIRELDRITWGRQLAYIPQETALFTGTLRENLVVSCSVQPTDEQLITVLQEVELSMLLNQGLDGMIGEEGNQLSRGEQQRLSIARAILQDPKLVLIDEATSSLDVYTERLLTRVLSKFCVGRTTVIVAHRLATIRHADSILVLDKGAIVQQGCFAELVAAKGLFASFWRLNTESERSTFEGLEQLLM